MRRTTSFLLTVIALAFSAACTGTMEDATGAPSSDETSDARTDDAGTSHDDTASPDGKADANTDAHTTTDAHDTGSTSAHDAGTDASDSRVTSSETSVDDTTPPPPVDAGPSSARQTARPLGSTTAPNGFYEYLPPGYSPTGAPAPLMLFWHGLGEDGNGTTDLSKVLVNGPPKLIDHDEWPADRPFVVLSPQNASGCPSGPEIDGFLTWAIANYSLDPKQLFLTGLSCGAIGSWDYLGGYAPTTPIAAAVLIAGDGHGAWDTQKCTLGRIAIWAFHGDADGTVATTGSTYPMTNLMACPSPPRRDAEMTIYPGVGHDSWTRTYDLSAGHDVYAWMLANHL